MAGLYATYCFFKIRLQRRASPGEPQQGLTGGLAGISFFGSESLPNFNLLPYFHVWKTSFCSTSN